MILLYPKIKDTIKKRTRTKNLKYACLYQNKKGLKIMSRKYSTVGQYRVQNEERDKKKSKQEVYHLREISKIEQ